MSSDYHKWVARNEKPHAVRELTAKEKRANWWYYHKRHVCLAIVLVLVLIFMAHNIAAGRATVPDCKVAYVASTFLPEETVSALERELALLAGDIDGNGHAIVQIEQHLMDPESEHYTTKIPDMQVMFIAHMASEDTLLFLLDDPETFQREYELLTGADGAKPAGTSGEPLWYLWRDCPVLTALPLGSYPLENAAGDSQALLSDLYIARAACPNKDEHITARNNAFWQHLTDGAAAPG